MRSMYEWHGGHAGVGSEIEIRWWGAFVEGDPCTCGRAKRPRRPIPGRSWKDVF